MEFFARDRVSNRMVLRQDDKLDISVPRSTELGKKWGLIISQVIMMGTVTRCAIERTRLTASNAKASTANTLISPSPVLRSSFSSAGLSRTRLPRLPGLLSPPIQHYRHPRSAAALGPELSAAARTGAADTRNAGAEVTVRTLSFHLACINSDSICPVPCLQNGMLQP